jgi:hypothetical protein
MGGERAGIPLWLFEACYPVVGDLSETIALVLPEATRDTDLPLADWIARLRALDKADEETRKAAILDAWDSLAPTERFVFNKLLTGGLAHGRQPEAHDPRAGAGHRHRRGRTDPPPDGRLDAPTPSHGTA